MAISIPELLAPAGSMEALKAAVTAGADAVYLGYSSFSARASAANFDEDTLREAVRFAHLYHVRVYVTVNTLIKPREIPLVRKTLEVISSCGADAVLVQDFGVAKIIRDEFPSLEIHASTQMALCNAEGVRVAGEAGFSRIVLARECTLDEIRLAAQAGPEIEVFVHGALCTAVSGRCLMSSFSGGRSGNRGRCAQPCRQQFRLGEYSGALLSMRDLCGYRRLDELCRAGVASLKIEGRLKSPEYVYSVVKEYRLALYRIKNDQAFHTPEGLENLKQAFNRGQFTEGHLFGAEDHELMTGNQVSHEGIPIGTVIGVKNGFASVRLSHQLDNGDSLQFHSKKSEETRYSGPDTESGEIALIRLRPDMVIRTGDALYRLTSSRQLGEARSSVPNRIPVSARASFSEGTPASLTLSDGTSTVTVKGEIPSRSVNRPAQVEDVTKQLLKFGDTPFSLSPEQLNITLGSDLFLPVSALNALRREAAEQLVEERIHAFSEKSSVRGNGSLSSPRSQFPVLNDTLAVQFSDPSMAIPLREAGASLLVWSPASLLPRDLEKDLSALPEEIWLRLPPQLTQASLEQTAQIIRASGIRFAGLWAESYAHTALFPDIPMISGGGIPFTNPEAEAFLKDYGFSAHTVCTEWSFSELYEPSGSPAFLPVYGRETLMLLNHCPYRVINGLQSDRKDCRICRSPQMVCGEFDPFLTDRKGYRFPLTRTRLPQGCEIAVLNSLPTDLSQYREDWSGKGFHPLLRFTTESLQEAVRITGAFAAFLRGDKADFPSISGTGGHFLHSVE